MLISIITISYNQGKFLEDAILSILNQNDPNVEHIIIDACSTDNTKEILEKYKDRVSRIIIEKDNGPADGLNKGFRLASGDILGYLNADDILLPNSIKEIRTAFEKFDNYDVISAHGHIINKDGVFVHKAFSNQINNHPITKQRYACGYTMLVQQSTFFRSKLYKKTNGFDESFKLTWDTALFIDFLNLDAKFKVLNRYWSGFRVYETSITGSGRQRDEKARLEFERLQKRAGFNALEKPKFFLYKYIFKLLEPKLLFMRIYDGLKNRQRLI